MTPAPGRLLFCATILAGLGCGGSSRAPAATPASGGAESGPDREATTTMSVPAGKSVPKTVSTPVAPSDPSRELASSEESFAAATDCASMCRALSSMERATEHLCALGDGGDSDKRRCAEARMKLANATVKVKATCGGC